MEWLIILGLIALGLGLIVVEFIFIPGTTIVGVLGLACSGYGVYLGYQYFGNTAGTVILGITACIALGALYSSLKSGAWERFSLKDRIESRVNEDARMPIVGDIGTAMSALRPYGTGDFDGDLREVQSFGGFVDSGKKIRVLKVENQRILVEEAKEME